MISLRLFTWIGHRHAETEGAHINAEAEGAPVNPEAEGVHINPMGEGAHRHAESEGAHINPEAEGAHVILRRRVPIDMLRPRVLGLSFLVASPPRNFFFPCICSRAAPITQECAPTDRHESAAQELTLFIFHSRFAWRVRRGLFIFGFCGMLA